MNDNRTLCSYCGCEYIAGETDTAANGAGFWCEECDAFNYFSSIAEDARHRFELNLEQVSNAERVSSVGAKLKLHVSPLRYPGGKTKVIPYAFARLNPTKTDLWVEPFAGGASVGLSLLEAGVINHLRLNDLDYGVYSLFKCTFTDPQPLLDKINTITPTREMFFTAQSRILNNHNYASLQDAAWDMLVVNRLSFSGIAKAHPLGGKNGSQTALLSRWNPETLTKRIELLRPLGGRVEVTNMDALEVIEECYWNEQATLFIDPPYVQKGSRLYNKFYESNDHQELGNLLDSLYSTCPGADIQLYYDDDEMVKNIYFYPEVVKVERRYCV